MLTRTNRTLGITYWRMDYCLKLYFANGKTTTINPGMLRYGQIGLDETLRSELASLTGYIEDDGGLVEGTAPETALPIAEAVLAQRTSVASKRHFKNDDARFFAPPGGVIIKPTLEAWEETHVVLGLRIGSMREVGYVYGYDGEDNPASAALGDVETEALKEGLFEDDGM